MMSKLFVFRLQIGFNYFQIKINNLSTCLVTFGFLVFSNSALAVSLNLNGFSVEDLQCNMSKMIGGNLINNSNSPFKGNLKVQIISDENKVIWSGKERVEVKAHNALKFSINTHSVSCTAPISIKVSRSK